MGSSFVWPPPKRSIKIHVVVPVSILSVEQTLREKTSLLGCLARALAIFRVSELALFTDPDSNESDRRVIKQVLNLIMTPPYLRKRVIDKDEVLRYAGILPPLNILTHPESKEVREGHVREGLAIKVRGRYARVYVGLDDDVIAEVPKDLANVVSEGSRVYVKIVKESPLRGIIVTSDEIPWYLGFSVKFLNNVEELVKYLKADGGLNIITSKYGLSITKFADEFLAMLGSTKSIRLLFGNPRKDFDELLDTSSLEGVARFRVNTIPLQGTRTVRTIEAIYSSLAVVNELLFSYVERKLYE